MPIADNTFLITLDTWITSDTHFFHGNIGGYCNRPENWQDLIFNNWNELIAPDEQVLHLGDFALGKKINLELGFIGSICYWLLEEGKSDPESFLNPASLGSAVLKAGGDKLYEEIQPILQELQRTRPDRQALLRQTFRFPRQVAAALGKKIVLICDELQEIRTLENYPNSQNVVALLRAELQSESEFQYILAGSATIFSQKCQSLPKAQVFGGSFGG